MMTALDPVTLAVIQNGLQQVCNEMDLAFVRAAFSPVISEALDRSDGIYHRDTGELIAQGDLGLPVFVGTMQFSTQAVIEREIGGLPTADIRKITWENASHLYRHPVPVEVQADPDAF